MKSADRGVRKASTALAAFLILAASSRSLWAGSVLEQLRREAAAQGSEAVSIPAKSSVEAPVAVESVVGGRRESRHSAQYREIARVLGLRGAFSVQREHLGSKLINSTEKATFSDGSREEVVVLKRFQKLAQAKWFITGRFRVAFQRTIYDATEQFNNEREMNAVFRRAGLRTLEIVATFPRERTIVTRLLRGTRLDAFVDAVLRGDDAGSAQLELFGQGLAAAHRRHLTVGDAAVTNFIIADGEVYFIDLDQASRDGRPGWDIAEFLYSMSASVNNTRETRGRGRWAAAARAFLSGYVKNGGDPGVVEDALDPVYLRPYGPFIVAEARDAVRREMRAFAGSGTGP